MGLLLSNVVGQLRNSDYKLSHHDRVVADVWEKDVWEFQADFGSSGSYRFFLHFLGKIAVQEMSGKMPGTPRHPSSRHPRPSDTRRCQKCPLTRLKTSCDVTTSGVIRSILTAKTVHQVMDCRCVVNYVGASFLHAVACKNASKFRYRPKAVLPQRCSAHFRRIFDAILTDF